MKIWLVVQRYDYEGFEPVLAYSDRERAEDLVRRAEEHRKQRPNSFIGPEREAWKNSAPPELLDLDWLRCDAWGIEEVELDP